MLKYILKRLLLLPVTLFFIVLANFIILNLAPGEPVYATQLGQGGEAVQNAAQASSGGDERYLQFREFFGLTLPILYNNWPWTTKEELLQDLQKLQKKNELSAKEYAKLKLDMGDKARFILPELLAIMQDGTQSFQIRKDALFFFLRGATKFSYSGANLSEKEQAENQEIGKNNLFIDTMRIRVIRNPEMLLQAIEELAAWYVFHPSDTKKISTLFLQTRFAHYMNRVIHLDFGVLRLDTNRSVIREVLSKLKYSLTLSLLPMVVTFFLCQIIGLLMAIWRGSLLDHSLNFALLILYATPVFVVGPFLIEAIALHHNYPCTNIPFPIRGFSSDDAIYYGLTTWQRFLDICRHLTLPLITILYASLAAQARLSRAVFIDTLNQDFVRTARAKGVPRLILYWIHVGRYAAIPILTSIAGSLGAILGGSVIVETIFDIHGFGKFFYDAAINRDYNVLMFSSLVGSFLSLLGYFVADLTYMWLDPRVALEASKE